MQSKIQKKHENTVPRIAEKLQQELKEKMYYTRISRKILSKIIMEKTVPRKKLNENRVPRTTRKIYNVPRSVEKTVWGKTV